MLLIASLGISAAIEALIAILFSSQFKTLSNLLPPETIFNINGAAVTSVQVLIIAGSLLTLFSFWLLLSYTKFGKAVRAIADDEEVAKIVGIDTDRIIVRVFVIGAAVMGLTGILVGFDTGLEPHMGFLLLLDGAIAAIVGGIGNVYGAFFAAYLLGFAENFGVWYVSGEWKYAIAFAVLIFFLLFRPQGFLGKK
ncbi:branched-chain amino acid ABC transporter permease [Candidatus Kaiserbacteria bacterium]|nr:branched-chain amino acid ABC transporter permease [Candidatus Kaiserbacteria bacterium]